jgi:hypothetical protein
MRQQLTILSIRSFFPPAASTDELYASADLQRFARQIPFATAVDPRTVWRVCVDSRLVGGLKRINKK